VRRNMTYQNGIKNDKELYEMLKVDCEKCFGLCCVALYFSASEGFPTDKVAGVPCINLQADFRCTIHKDLMQKGLKGCIAYDCFGAGQKVAQATYNGQDWRDNPKIAEQMYDVYLIIRQLHEMLWYLVEAQRVQADRIILNEISNMIGELDCLTNQEIASLLELDIEANRTAVNVLLSKTSELIRVKACKGKKTALKGTRKIAGRRNLIGSDLRKTNLIGEDLRGVLLIAANLNGVDLSGADLIGADLRDTDLRGANLLNSIFLTQAQINAAKGDTNTKLPVSLIRPAHWAK
jgi:uncharacterized protein YjbI with pentapeptide repeats